MITLTRLDGTRIGLNHHQIERIDAVANTIITMVSGNQYIVSESLEEVVEAIAEFESQVLEGHPHSPRERAQVRWMRQAHVRSAGESSAETEEN